MNGTSTRSGLIVFMVFLVSAQLKAGDELSPISDKIKFYFNNEEISKVLENFSRVSGKKMIVESSVRGKISIFNPDTVDVDEAFNQVSKALSMTGYAFVPEGDTLVVRPVRQIQRSLIEVGTELPPLKPERMFSWVVTLKNIPTSVIRKNLRSLSSKDGEHNVIESNNQIIFVDWISNLYRIRELIKQIDIPKNPDVDRLIKEYSKNSKNK
jgi:type II secretory pathway component GspD/PulD (secretin)